jgi:hypothetical protein
MDWQTGNQGLRDAQIRAVPIEGNLALRRLTVRVTG